jgi:hypothetical protein
MKKFGLLFIIFFCFSCASTEVGTKIDMSSAQKIEIGKSTEADVLQTLGQPMREKINPDGSKKWGYAHIEAKAYALPFYATGKGKADRVIIEFDQKGVVKSIDRTSTEK